MRAVLILAAGIGLALAAGTRAEDVPAAPPAGVDEGFDLVEEGARLILRHMMRQVEPALDDMRRDLGTALAEWEPALRQLAALAGDIANYEAPEMLPNGDIIIRRKRPFYGPAAPGPNGEIDL